MMLLCQVGCIEHPKTLSSTTSKAGFECLCVRVIHHTSFEGCPMCVTRLPALPRRCMGVVVCHMPLLHHTTRPTRVFVLVF